MRPPEVGSGAPSSDPVRRTSASDAPEPASVANLEARRSLGKRNVAARMTDAKTLAEPASTSDRGGMEKIENIEIRLTEDERASYRERFVAISAEIEELTEEKNRVRTRCDRQIRERRAELKALLEVLDRGVEVRRIAVLEEKDLHEGTLLVRRADTGEALYARPLTQDEMQADLPFVHRRPADVLRLRAAAGPTEGSASSS